MKPLISIVMPAIRRDRWDGVYNSILSSTSKPWELIIVGPHNLTEYLTRKSNVKSVRDFGSPTRASNLGALLAEGELITWTSDDAVFLEGELDRYIEELRKMGDNYKNVIVGKYYEGVGQSSKNEQDDSYYTIGFSDATSLSSANGNWFLFNVAVMYKKFFDELGGWDCSFQACPMAHADFGIRAQASGAVTKILPTPLLNCDHMPGMTGDHGPIHLSQVYEDQPLFKRKYYNGLKSIPLSIDIGNWKNSPAIWSKRFHV